MKNQGGTSEVSGVEMTYNLIFESKTWNTGEAIFVEENTKTELCMLKVTLVGECNVTFELSSREEATAFVRTWMRRSYQAGIRYRIRKNSLYERTIREKKRTCTCNGYVTCELCRSQGHR